MDVELLKRKKYEKGYSLAQIAKLSGVPLGTVQKIFAGETKHPRYKTLQALESVLGSLSNDKQAESRYRYTTSSGEGQPGMLRDALPAYSVSGYTGYASHPEDESTRAGLPAGKKQGEYTLADYFALPEDRRAELIDGRICDMAAPNLLHQMLSGEIYYQLMSYLKGKNGPCLPFISPVDVQLDADEKTMVQPDAGVLCDRDKLYKGRIIGAPDFVAEILSDATRKRDMTWKLHKYAQAGVREYWIVDPRRKVIVIYFFEGEDYPVIYRMGEKIPVQIYSGELEIETKGMLPWTENEKLG